MKDTKMRKYGDLEGQQRDFSDASIEIVGEMKFER